MTSALAVLRRSESFNLHIPVLSVNGIEGQSRNVQSGSEHGVTHQAAQPRLGRIGGLGRGQTQAERRLHDEERNGNGNDAENRLRNTAQRSMTRVAPRPTASVPIRSSIVMDSFDADFSCLTFAFTGGP